jgi:hypothetical protein
VAGYFEKHANEIVSFPGPGTTQDGFLAGVVIHGGFAEGIVNDAIRRDTDGAPSECRQTISGAGAD